MQFTQPSIVPESAFPRILELMATGRLFRYCGKGGAEGSDASVAEQMVADYIGADYCIGVNSCSSAVRLAPPPRARPPVSTADASSAPQIYLALLALGVKHGDQVITNGFTFTALPSTIKHAGATPVLVEANENFTMNVEDLEKKIAANPHAKVMILSHFRGKLSDCDKIREICDNNGILMVSLLPAVSVRVWEACCQLSLSATGITLLTPPARFPCTRRWRTVRTAWAAPGTASRPAGSATSPCSPASRTRS